MSNERPSIHDGEIFSERYTPGGTLRDTPSAISPDAEAVFVDLRHATLAPHLAIPEADVCERLRRAVEEAAARDADSMKELHRAVSSFTVALRDLGTTPERVLVALKTVINNPSLVVIAPHVSDWNGVQLREKISAWCIEEFFSENTA